MINRSLIAVDESKTDGDIEVINFTKYMPYILYLTFYKHEVGKSKEVVRGYTIPKVPNLNYYM